MGDSKLSKLADELDDADEITETHIHVHGAAQVEADATGKVKAVSIPDDDRVTPTDPPRAKPDSAPPRSGFVGIVQAGGGVVVRVVQAVNNPYALLALALLVGGFVAWLKLRP